MTTKCIFRVVLNGLCVLALGIALLFNSSRAQETKDSTQTSTFLHNGVTAHRGDSLAFPENTLPAFDSAIELGVDWLELDIFRTADGKLVVTHDRQTGRVGDRDLNVLESTYDELHSIDVATQFRNQNKLTMEQCPAQHMPLLSDVLPRVMRQTKTRVSIQPKMACVPEAIALIRQLKCEAWCGFNDGNLELMSEVKQLAPEIPVFWDRGPTADIDADVKIALQRGFEAMVLHRSIVNPTNIKKIKDAKLEIGAWTVSDLETLHRFKMLGVERIYTDAPSLLLNLQSNNRLNDVACEGRYPKHLQGICLDNEHLFWSFTTQLIMTDYSGKVLTKIAVDDHHGDLCHVDGKIYVAVNLGKFNDPAGNADNWIYVYDALTLREVARHPIPQVFHGAGGIAFRDGKFYLVGGLAPGVEENYVYEYDEQFNFQTRHNIASGYTLMGIQTAAILGDRWWFGCYGEPKTLLTTDANFQDVRRIEFNASLGIIGLSDGRLLVASGQCLSGQGCDGHVKIVLPSELGITQ